MIRRNVPDGYIRFSLFYTDIRQMIPYHDGKGVPPEETTVYIRDDADCECTVGWSDNEEMEN